MRIKEINVEVKKSKNFQTYTAGEVIVLEEGDKENEIRAERMAICRKAVLEQMRLDMPK